MREILSCVVLLLGVSAFAQVQMTLEAGIGDNVPIHGTWPARVVVQNETDELIDGRVVLELYDNLAPSPSVRAISAMELPPRSSKVLFSYLSAPASAVTLRARYENAREKALAETEVQITQLPTELPVVLGVGRPPAGFPPTSKGEQQVYYALSTPAEKLPPDVDGLLQFDAIIFSPPPYQPLSQPQAEALRAWVLQGGVLLIDASRRTDFFQEGALATWLPYVPQSGQQGDLAGFNEPLPYTTGTHRSGEVVVSAGEQPIVVREPLGLGSVAVFAADPVAVARTYDNPDSLWKVLLGHLPLWDRYGYERLAMSGNGSEFAVRSSLGSSLAQGPASSVRLGLVILLTALYAIAVGPGDYWLVKRLGKPKLTWITFPLIVAGFTVAAYAGARYYVGGQLSAAATERLAVFADSDAALRTTVYSVFSPAGRDYRVELPEEGRVQPALIDLQPGDPPVRMAGDGKWVEERIAIWTRKNYMASNLVAAPPDLAVSIAQQDGRILATVTNNSSETLVQHAIAYGEAYFRVEDVPVAPGESHTFELGDTTVLEREDVRPWAEREWQNAAPVGTDMAIVHRGPTPPLGGMRAMNLRPALDRGAVVWMCRPRETATRSVLVNGDELEATTPVAIQVISYEGVQL